MALYGHIMVPCICKDTLRPIYPNGNVFGYTGPVGPFGSVDPVGPVNPVDHVGPDSPVGLVGPVGPIGPVGPVGHVGPVNPVVLLVPSAMIISHFLITISRSNISFFNLEYMQGEKRKKRWLD